MAFFEQGTVAPCHTNRCMHHLEWVTKSWSLCHLSLTNVGSKETSCRVSAPEELCFVEGSIISSCFVEWVYDFFQPILRFNTKNTLRLHPRGPSHRLGRYGRYGAHSPAGNGERGTRWQEISQNLLGYIFGSWRLILFSPFVGRFGSWRFPARDMINLHLQHVCQGSSLAPPCWLEHHSWWRTAPCLDVTPYDSPWPSDCPLNIWASSIFDVQATLSNICGNQNLEIIEVETIQLRRKQHWKLNSSHMLFVWFSLWVAGF